MANILCISGWGLTSIFFEPLVKLLQTDVDILTFDKYIYSCNKDKFNQYQTVIAHSMGNLFLFKHLHLFLSQTNFFCFNLFNDFCYSENNIYGTNIKIIYNMIKNIKQNPTQVLKLFYQNCFVDVNTFLNNKFTDTQLIDGLKYLQNENINLELNNTDKLNKFNFIFNNNDKIINLTQSTHIIKKYKLKNYQLVNGEHGDLYNNPKIYYEVIKNWTI